MYHTAFFICSLVLCSVSANYVPYFRSTGWGRCPKVSPQSNFSLENFDGLWYFASELASQYVDCQVFNMTATSESSMDVDLIMQQDRNTIVKFSAKANTRSNSKAGSLHWSWNLASMINEEFTVLSTDYNNYATIFLCHDFVFFHKKSFIIISRQNKLNETYVKKGQNAVDTYFQTSPYSWRTSYSWCFDVINATVEYNADKVFKDVLNFRDSFGSFGF